MILTSHRLDCFKLCMDLLIQGKSIYDFDQVVLLLNGVEGRHRRYVEGLQWKHANIPWDTISGPRGRGKYISNLQNQCVEKYPNALYFKIDEDTFVSTDWSVKLLRAYEEFKYDPSLSLITPIIPNNALGCYCLLQHDEELRDEYERLFPEKEISSRCDAPVWLYPQIAEWISRKFLNLTEANQWLVEHIYDPYSRFGERFSINCICYDYRHWKEIGGVPEQDEVGWGEWIEKNNKPAVVVHDSLVHHYSYFVQQRWLDRTSLLEDLRNANLEGKECVSNMAGNIYRALRIFNQCVSSMGKSFLNHEKS